MASLKAANATKYDNGGSGDTVISDGYIKSVEKVWIDSYAFATALTTAQSICIGVVPKGKHIREVTVYMPVTHSLPTLSTVWLQTGATVTAAGYFGSLKADGYQTSTYNGATAGTLRLASGYQDKSFDAEQKLYITIHPSDSAAIVSATGTIRSIIKWT